MTWHLVNQVWGAAYVEKFLTFCLPTLLAPNNLPHLARRGACRFKLYTHPEEAATLRAAPVFQQLCALMPVEILLIDELQEERRLFEALFQGPHKFATMSACHWHAIHAAWEEEAILSFLSPDVVYANGTFAHLDKLVQEGWRAAMITGLHTAQATFGPGFLARFPADARGAATAEARPLVALAMANLHPFAENLFIGPEGASVFSQLYWRPAPDGILARAWHLMPIMVRPLRAPIKPFWSTDTDYLAQVLDDPATIRVLDDSDDAFLAELLPEDAERTVRPRETPFNMLHYALHAREMFLFESHWGKGAQNLAMVRRTIRFHGGSLTPAWDAAQHESDCFVDAMLAWIEFLERQPLALREMSLLARGTPGQDTAYFLQGAFDYELKTGLAFLQEARWAEAESALRRAAALKPERYKPLINLGRCLLAQDRPQEALAPLEAALQLDPGNLEALEEVRQAALRLKRPLTPGALP